MIIANRQMSYQISEFDFDVICKSKTFDDNATLDDIKKWYEELNHEYHFYASSVITIQFEEEKKL